MSIKPYRTMAKLWFSSIYLYLRYVGHLMFEFVCTLICIQKYCEVCSTGKLGCLRMSKLLLLDVLTMVASYKQSGKGTCRIFKLFVYRSGSDCSPTEMMVSVALTDLRR